MKTLLRIIILALLVVSFLFPALYYAQLPEEIPIHFNAIGEADGFGKKSTIWLLPILNVVNVLIIFAISSGAKYMPKQKKQPPYFAEIVGIYVLILTTYIGIANVLIAVGELKTLGTWFLPFVIILSMLLVGYLFIQQRKMKLQNKK
ncbi:DUF1648 domain-containing protein [Rasiella sp. SM2506]|uniref:DUF1648 domain-containing protein n=1 Tax=Rasiella sp. SM2506 TaxID=3423914 RepID=UPI003D7A756B